MWVFPTGFSRMVFPSVRGLRVMANAFLPIQPDVTSMEHVLGKVGHLIGIAGCFVGCILDILHSTSYAPREAFR